jgi:hypothetical protein
MPYAEMQQLPEADEMLTELLPAIFASPRGALPEAGTASELGADDEMAD